MMTSSNGNIFRVIGPLCGEFTGPGEFPTQRSVTRSFDVFFDLRLNKRLSKQPWGWWFEMPSWSLWRQCNAQKINFTIVSNITWYKEYSLSHHIRSCKGSFSVLCCRTPNNKVHGANMGPICGRQDAGGPHVGPMNFANFIFTRKSYWTGPSGSVLMLLWSIKLWK